MDAKPHLQNVFPPLILSKTDYWCKRSVIHSMHFDSFRRIFVEIGWAAKVKGYIYGKKIKSLSYSICFDDGVVKWYTNLFSYFP